MTHEPEDVSNSQNSASGSIFIRSRTMLAEICRRMRPHLKWIARQQTQRLPNCKDDESDIVQQSVVKAYERFDQFEGKTTRQWRAWLIQIVRNHAKDVQRYWSQERRSHKNEENGSQVMKGLADSSVETPSKLVAEQELHQQFEHALASLPSQQQRLIRWKKIENLTYREIAKRLGINDQAAKRQCLAAVKAFEEAFVRLDG